MNLNENEVKDQKYIKNKDFIVIVKYLYFTMGKEIF